MNQCCTWQMMVIVIPQIDGPLSNQVIQSWNSKAFNSLSWIAMFLNDLYKLNKIDHNCYINTVINLNYYYQVNWHNNTLVFRSTYVSITFQLNATKHDIYPDNNTYFYCYLNIHLTTIFLRSFCFYKDTFHSAAGRTSDLKGKILQK